MNYRKMRTARLRVNEWNGAIPQCASKEVKSLSKPRNEVEFHARRSGVKHRDTSEADFSKFKPTFYIMNRLLIPATLIWSLSSNAQVHRLERVCGIQKITTDWKLFNEKEISVFNDDCLLSSRKSNDEKVFYTYVRTKSYDSVFERVKPGSKIDLKFVYYFDSLGRLSQLVSNWSDKTTTLTYYYHDSANRLILTRHVGKYLMTEQRYFYDSNSSRMPNTCEEYVDGKLKRRSLLNYDDKGNITLRDEYSWEGEEWVRDSAYVGGFPCSPCEYEYDSSGNWIRQYILDNKRRVLYATRRIKYRK